jgi:HK97 family phage prohead protease
VIRFSPLQVTVDAAGPDGAPSRSITGLAAPYDVVATVSDGQRVKFLPGSLPADGPAPKLIQNHDLTQPIGIVSERVDTEQGMMFRAKISKTRAGDDALALALDGVLDSVSVGAEPVEASYDDDGTLVVSKARWMELSLVPFGAFPAAKITQVAATPAITETTEDTEVDKTPIAEVKETPAAAPAPSIVFAEPRRVPGRLPTAAEYVSAFIRGGDAFAAVNRVIADHQAHHNPVQAAAGDQVTGDAPGLLPVPILGPVYDNINYLRPVVSAIGARAMPSVGATFIRPEITTHTSVAQQSAQLDPLSSTTMVISANTVTKLTFGGTVKVAEQLGDWSDPAFVNIVLQDLANQYADATDNYAADQLRSGSTDQGTWGGTAETLLTEIYTAAQLISASTNVLPTHLFVDPEMWAKLGGLVDGSDRPLFPTVAPFNASNASYGANNWNGNPLGLSMVVDKNFTAKTAIVGCAAGPFAGFEIFEQQKGAVSVEKPDILARQISFRGYFATLMLDATKFRRFTYA